MAVPKDFKYPKLLEEWPFTYAIHNKYSSTHCHFCLKGKETKTLSRCSRCKFAHYCDKNCQMAAFKDHRNECKFLVELKGKIPSVKTRLIARIVFKKDCDYNPDKNLPVQLQSRRFTDLMSHKSELMTDINENKSTFEKKSAFEQLCVKLNEFIGKDNPTMDYIDLINIYGKLAINDFGIIIGGETIAEGLYIGASVMNHSCDPDAFVCFDGPKILVRALKPGLEKKSLSEVTFGYFDTYKTTRERRAIAAERYYFHCECAYCLDEQRDGEMCSLLCPNCSGTAILNAKKNMALCQKCQKTIDATTAMQLMDEIEDHLKLFEKIQSQGQQLDGTEMNDRIKSQLPNTNETISLLDQLVPDLDKRARALLSPINVYGCRMAEHMLFLTGTEGLLEECAAHCERSLKGIIRFTNVVNDHRLKHFKNAGITCVYNPAKKDEGYRLLKEAEHGFELTADYRQAEECRSILAQAQMDYAALAGMTSIFK